MYIPARKSLKLSTSALEVSGSQRWKVLLINLRPASENEINKNVKHNVFFVKHCSAKIQIAPECTQKLFDLIKQFSTQPLEKKFHSLSV